MKILVLAPGEETCIDVALYTQQLFNALQVLGENSIELIQMSSCSDIGNKHGANLSIDTANLGAYIDAANSINKTFDICLLQYHPEAFGGLHGNYILALLSQLTIPAITTLHNVNCYPYEEEKVVYQAIARFSTKILVFNNLSIEFLEHYYKINRDILIRTEHAVLDYQALSKSELCDVLGLKDSRVVVSAGSLKATNGYKTVIDALPSIINQYSNVCYVIINMNGGGAESEYNKKSLLHHALQRGIPEHVKVINRAELSCELEAVYSVSEAFVSAHYDKKELNNAQLAKAVSSGAAVLSTPTWIAKEILEDQKGAFFSFKSSNELSYELLSLLRNTNEQEMYRDNAALYGEQNTWAIVGRRLIELAKQCVVAAKKEPQAKQAIQPNLLPGINLNHLLHLTDATGVLRQSRYNVLDYNKGYHLWDNALALHTYAYAYNHTRKQVWLDRINTCLAFISSLYDSNNGWSASMTYDRKTSLQSSEIAEARAVWALGFLYATTNSTGIKDVAYDLIHKLLGSGFENLRAKAYAIMGIVRVLKFERTNTDLQTVLEQWAEEIYMRYPSDVYSSWYWHEEKMTSDLALVPLALSFASDTLQNKDYLAASKRALRFLQNKVFTESQYNHDAIKPQRLGLQGQSAVSANGIEATLMSTACSRLYQITKEARYLKLLKETHYWYLGNNSIGKSLYHPAHGGCFAYINGRSVSPEQTAESTCSYWLSYFTMLEAYFDELAN